MQQAAVPAAVPAQNERTGAVIPPPSQLTPMARGAPAAPAPPAPAHLPPTVHGPPAPGAVPPASQMKQKKKYNRNVPQKEFSCKVCGTLCKQEKAKYGTCIKCVRFYNRTVREADFFAGRKCPKDGQCDLTRQSGPNNQICPVCRYHKCKELGLEAVKDLPTRKKPAECKLYECKACGKTCRKNRGKNLFCEICFSFFSTTLMNDSAKYKNKMCPKGGGCNIMCQKGILRGKSCKWCLYQRCVQVEAENSGLQNVPDATNAQDAPNVPEIPEVSENSESPQQLSPAVQKPQGNNCRVCGKSAFLSCKSVACNACYAFFITQVNAQKAGQELKCEEDAAICALVRDPRLFRKHCKKCRFERCLETGLKTKSD